MARKLTPAEEIDFAQSVMDREDDPVEEAAYRWADLQARRDAELVVSPQLRELLDREFPERWPDL